MLEVLSKCLVVGWKDEEHERRRYSVLSLRRCG